MGAQRQKEKIKKSPQSATHKDLADFYYKQGKFDSAFSQYNHNFKQIKMWKNIYSSTEKILGFSFPKENAFLLITLGKKENFLVNICSLQETILENKFLEEIHELCEDKRRFVSCKGNTYEMLGLYGGLPITESDQNEKVLLNLEKNIFLIEKYGQIIFEFSFPSPLGCWRYVTFSQDFNFVLLGFPNFFFLFERE